MLDCCLEPGNIDALKMLDLETKSAIDSTDPLVLLQATHRNFKIGRGLNQIIQHIVGDG